MYSVVIAVEPGAPRFCQLVADREVGFPKKKGWSLFQQRTNMYTVGLMVEPEVHHCCQLVADREVDFPKKKGSGT